MIYSSTPFPSNSGNCVVEFFLLFPSLTLYWLAWRAAGSLLLLSLPFYKFFVSIARHTKWFDHIFLPFTNSSQIHLVFFPTQLCVYVFNPS